MKIKKLKSLSIKRAKKISPLNRILDEKFLDAPYKDNYSTFKEVYKTRREFIPLKLRREKTVFSILYNFFKKEILKAYLEGKKEVTVDYTKLIPTGKGDSRNDFYVLGFLLSPNTYEINYNDKVIKIEINSRGENKARLKGFKVVFK